MRTIRVHHEGPLHEGGRVPLGDRAATHLLRVLRLRDGAEVVVFDGAGLEFEATLDGSRPIGAALRIGARRPALPASPLRIVLAQGVSRGDRMEYAIQKATELGVHAIVPLLCERSVVRLDSAQASKKQEHWAGVAIAAAEQSGRADVPAVAVPVPLLQHLATATPPLPTDALKVRLALDPLASTTLNDLPDNLAAVELLIGPEGGLSATELDLARRAGYQGVRLGPRILRTETAAAAAIAILQALRGDLL